METSLANQSFDKFAALSPGDFLGRLEALVPTFRERAWETEQARRLSVSSMEMLRDAGAFRVLQPRRFGGFEFGFSQGLKTNLTLARGCGSTAWSVCQGMFHNFLVALYPLEAQQEVWDDPTSVVASGFMPTGKCVPVEGGYKLSGAWPYASNCDNADWFLGGAMVPPASEGGPPLPGLFLIPRRDIRIEDTWFNAGMAGSGSKTFVADEPIFVPRHRMLTMETINSGAAPGSELYENPMYQVRFSHLGPSFLVSVAIGVALAAVTDFVEIARSKMALRMGAPPIAMAQLPHVQRTVGEASAAADAALTILMHDVTEVEAGLREGRQPDLELRLRMRRNQAYIGRVAVQAVNQIMEVSGASSTALSSPIQRAWRDVNTVVSHVSLAWAPISSMYGQHRLGLVPVGSY